MTNVKELVPSFFVAYTQRDEAFAKAIGKALRSLDLDFYSMNDNPIGIDFIQEGQNQMTAKTCVIALISVHDSDWVKKEVFSAYSLVKKVFPVICQRGDHESFRWPAGIEDRHNCTTIHDPDQQNIATLLLKGFVEAGIFDRGIVPIAALTHKPEGIQINPFQRIEQFAAELVGSPLSVSQSNDEIHIRMNRTRGCAPEASCRYAVISNSGKKELQKHFVHPRLSEIEKTEHDLENLISGTPSNEHTAKALMLPNNLPMRWASGGVLPIITFRGKKWVALLFRDIAPYGWNIPLGSSERYSCNHDDISHATDLWEAELRRPEKLSTREFLEEILVLDRTPEQGNPVRVKPFSFVNEMRPDFHTHYQEFSQNHIKIRAKDDNLFFHANPNDDDNSIHVSERQGTKCYLDVFSETNKHTHHGFIISLNPSEMGIEMVLPLLFTLKDNDYLLDGEIVTMDDQPELVRMPIALFSVDYLNRVFAGSQPFSYEAVPLTCEDPLCPAESRAPSIRVHEKLSQEDFHLFDWDVKRRIAISLQPTESADSQKGMLHKRWVKLFGSMFENPPASLPTWFTPTTAKTIRMAIATGLL